MKPVYVCFGYLPLEWAIVARNIIEEEITLGNTVFLVDASNFVYPKLGLPSTLLSRLLGVRDDFSIENVLGLPGVLHIKLNHVYHKVKDSRFLEEVLPEALKSTILSHFGDSKPSQNIGISAYFHSRMKKKTQALFHSYYHYMKDKDPLKVYIFNGRLSDSKTMTYISRDVLGQPTLFLEVGKRPGTIFARSYTAHDRISQIEDFMEWKESGKIRQEDILEAESWLNSKMQPNSSSNPYSRAWKELVIEDSSGESGQDLAIFTNSTDELWALGEMWQKDSWESQMQGFANLLDHLDLSAYRNLWLRVHPILTEKSFFEMCRQTFLIFRLKFRYPNLRVVWPTDSINSYSIIMRSKLIIVGSSNIGLEASYLGKQVICTEASFYLGALDVSTYFSEGQLKKSESLESDIVQNALEFTAFLRIRDKFLKKPIEVLFPSYSEANSFQVKLLDLSSTRSMAHLFRQVRHTLIMRLNRSFSKFMSLFLGRQSKP